MRTLGGAVKELAKQVNEASNPADLRYGTVTKVNPLKIHITSTFILPKELIIVPEHLTDYEVKITTSGYGWVTDNASGGSGDAQYASHNHGINQSQRTIKVHGALKVGDRVALMRESGGRKYFVLDRF